MELEKEEEESAPYLNNQAPQACIERMNLTTKRQSSHHNARKNHYALFGRAPGFKLPVRPLAKWPDSAICTCNGIILVFWGSTYTELFKDFTVVSSYSDSAESGTNQGRPIPYCQVHLAPGCYSLSPDSFSVRAPVLRVASPVKGLP